MKKTQVIIVSVFGLLVLLVIWTISAMKGKEENQNTVRLSTDNKDVTITDVKAQLERTPLRKQAETAKKYLVLRDELRTLEISVWLENLQKLKADRLKLQADFETAQADQKKAQDELDRVYAQAEECSRLLHENDCAAEEKRGRISALESAIGEHESAASSLAGICVIMRQCSARNIYCAKRYIFTRLRQSLRCVAVQIQPILLCIAC